MAKFMTTKEASEKWDITERRINVLCKEGRIPGAYKENKRWIIPADAGIRHIGDYAYSQQSSNDLVIPEGVISIGEHAFEYASGMLTLTIPSSVTLIKKEALIGCRSLRTINYSGTMAQWEAIEKGADWDKYTGAFVVHCTDGDI